MSGLSFDRDREQKRWRNFLGALTGPALELGGTPRQAVWSKNKATLWHYPAKERKYAVPLFLVYSLVNRPDILDLQPGVSIVEAFVESGFDVYLLDFGIPGYEDRDITLDDYITEYIQKGVQRALRHSGAAEISVIGFCMGGTLAVIYAAVAEEPIRNLLLMVTPVDFSHAYSLEEWTRAVQRGETGLNEVAETYGIIPASFMKGAVRSYVSPVYFSPYLSLLSRADDDAFVAKWRRFSQWTDGHIPFAGAALQQMMQDLGQENRLMKGSMHIRGKRINLADIHASLLVVAAKNDRLVPQEQVSPVMNLVSSTDKTYFVLEGGHTQLIMRKGLPAFLQDWLPPRSQPL